jgi:Domain of unknown function (DUF397)
VKTNNIAVNAAGWRKSRRSNGSGNCVEVAALAEGQHLAIRDSKDPLGPVLLVSTGSWRSLTASLLDDDLR